MAKREIDGFILEEAAIVCPECQYPFTTEILVESRKVNTSDLIEADLHRVFNDPELRAVLLSYCPNCKFCAWKSQFKPYGLKPELLRKEPKIEASKKYALAVKWARQKKVHSLDIAFIALNGLWCAREAGEADNLWLELAIYEHEKGVAASLSRPEDDGLTHLIMGELYRQHRDFDKAESEYLLAERDHSISPEVLQHVRMMAKRKSSGVTFLPLNLARLYFEIEDIRSDAEREAAEKATQDALAKMQSTTVSSEGFGKNSGDIAASEVVAFSSVESDQNPIDDRLDKTEKEFASNLVRGNGDTGGPLLAAINSLFSHSQSFDSFLPVPDSSSDVDTVNQASAAEKTVAEKTAVAEKAVAERAEAEKAAADKAAAEKVAAEKAAAEKAAAEKAAAEKVAAEKAAAEKAAAEKVAAEKAAAEKAAAEKVAAEKAVAVKAAAEKAAAEKAAAEKAAAEKVAAEKAAAEKAAAEKAAAEKVAAEKAAAEKAAAEKAVAAKKAADEKAAAEKAVAAKKAADEKAAAEKVGEAAERAVAAKALSWRVEAEKAGAEKSVAKRGSSDAFGKNHNFIQNASKSHNLEESSVSAELAKAELAAANRAESQKDAFKVATTIKSALEQAIREKHTTDSDGLDFSPHLPSSIDEDGKLQGSTHPKLKQVPQRRSKSEGTPDLQESSVETGRQSTQPQTTTPAKISRASVITSPVASSVNISITSVALASETNSSLLSGSDQNSNGAVSQALVGNSSAARNSMQVKPARDEYYFERRRLANNSMPNKYGWTNDYVEHYPERSKTDSSVTEGRSEQIKRHPSEAHVIAGERQLTDQDSAVTAVGGSLPGLAIDDQNRGKDYSDAINRVEKYLSFSRRVYSRDWMKL